MKGAPLKPSTPRESATACLAACESLALDWAAKGRHDLARNWEHAAERHRAQLAAMEVP